MWLVKATPPHPMVNTGWDFKPGHFPRKVAYKRDAQKLAEEAKRKGGINVSIEKAQ